MDGTRYKLIGECVVFIVKSPDAILKRVLTELKQVKKLTQTDKLKRKMTHRQHTNILKLKRKMTVKQARAINRGRVDAGLKKIDFKVLKNGR